MIWLQVYARSYSPCSTLVQAKDKGSQCEADETQGTRVCKFCKWRERDLRNHTRVLGHMSFQILSIDRMAVMHILHPDGGGLCLILCGHVASLTFCFRILYSASREFDDGDKSEVGAMLPRSLKESEGKEVVSQITLEFFIPYTRVRRSPLSP